MKTDVVYKLGVTADWGDFNELRYSIRSVEQNFKDLDKIYIVGHRPRWLQNIVHISASDSYRTNKDANLISKLMLASVHPEISKRFINISDDQYIMNEVTTEDLEHPIIDNSHIQFIPGAKLNRWQSRLKRTVDVLKKNGFKNDCYEAHSPYLLDSEDYMSTLMKYDYGFDIGYCGNTLYFNSIKAKGRMKTGRDLFRVTKPLEHDALMSKISYVKFLNHSNKGLNINLQRILKEKFPNKSKYETF